MKAKPKKSQTPVVGVAQDAPPPDPKTLRVDDTGEKSQEAFLAGLTVSPHVNAMMTVKAYALGVFKDVAVSELCVELKDQIAAVRSGNLERAEAMLVAQAHSLDAIFTNLAQRAALNAGEYIGACETYLKLALRAQSQCRATVETLAAIKNPPVVFAKQANIAHGPQQVNNGVASEPARAEEKTIKPTELLGSDQGERLDTGAASATGRSNPIMETVATLNRAAHRRRKGRRKP